VIAFIAIRRVRGFFKGATWSEMLIELNDGSEMILCCRYNDVLNNGTGSGLW